MRGLRLLDLKTKNRWDLGSFVLEGRKIENTKLGRQVGGMARGAIA